MKPDHAAIHAAYDKWRGTEPTNARDHLIFGAGYLAGQRAPVPAREWIPVGERLPDVDTYQLAFDARTGISVAWYATFKRGWASVPGDWARHPTHWMPLPTAPEGKV